MNATLKEEEILRRALNPAAVRAEGANYTSPRTYGVYCLTGTHSHGRTYRFGNHPVRLNELIRDFGHASLTALFIEREDARELADFLNRRT